MTKPSHLDIKVPNQQRSPYDTTQTSENVSYKLNQQDQNKCKYENSGILITAIDVIQKSKDTQVFP